ncbi:MAG: mechanosensitive ion channel family protein [Candidatus Delongbacteria bacterium]
MNQLHFDGARLLLAAGILLGMLLVRLIFQKVILRHLMRVTALTSMRHDDLVLEAIQPPMTAFLLSLGVYWSLVALQLPTTPLNLPRYLELAWHATAMALVIWLLYRLITPLAAFLEDRLFSGDETGRRQFAPILTGVLRFLLITLAAVFVAHNLGYQVTSLLAGLGIGGLAVALAAQDTLANILGTVVVLSDRPFRVGDWVRVDGQEGTVEGIGFRSTRIRTFSKSLIVVPNKLLTEKQIENWSAMTCRRVKMSLGLLYATEPERLTAFVEDLRQLLVTDPGVDAEAVTVAFTEFGTSSLDVLVVYFTHAIPYDEHLVVRQRINLAILRLAAARGVEFAFPTRTVQLEQPR